MTSRHKWRRYGLRSISHFLFPISLIFALSIAPASASPVFPFAPDPAACLQEPISLDDARSNLATPAAATTPLNRLPAGTTASDIVAVEVERVIVEVFACHNAGEPLRAFALYSNDYLGQILPGAVVEIFATPTPLDPDEWTTIIDIRDVRILPDGRVAATVFLDPALIPVDKTFVFILIEQDGRWLVDDVLDELEFSLP